MNNAAARRRWGDKVTVVDHPLVLHKLSLMRQKETSTVGFRRLMREVGMLLAYELTRDLELEEREIETPLTTASVPFVAGKKLCVTPILRAGIGLADGILDLIPAARVAHIGLYRDPTTLGAVEYYFKIPDDMAERRLIVVDPMLATGNSAIAAVDRIKEYGVDDVRMCALLAAPEGLDAFTGRHGDVPVWVAAIDERLDEHGYIHPGLGDAGDRLYGTK